MSAPADESRTVDPRLDDWIAERTGFRGPWKLHRLTGGNSNETCLLRAGEQAFVLRRPPQHALSSSAHSVTREHAVLSALSETAVPAPRPIALCTDEAVPMAPFMLMERVADAVSVTERLPTAYWKDASALQQVADEVVDALATVHALDWRAAGLADFGRPERFLERQVPRWYGQWERIARRSLPQMTELADWLDGTRPADRAPALMHGDFHLDNCLVSTGEPRLRAVIDWEMATIGDPLLDLGLLVTFWGRRPLDHPAMPAIQAVSRHPEAPPREHLVARYEQTIGARTSNLEYYRCLALFKLAAIVEAAYSQHLAGELNTRYAAALEHDVPAMLEEARITAGLSG